MVEYSLEFQFGTHVVQQKFGRISQLSPFTNVHHIKVIFNYFSLRKLEFLQKETINGNKILIIVRSHDNSVTEGIGKYGKKEVKVQFFNVSVHSWFLPKLPYNRN